MGGITEASQQQDKKKTGFCYNKFICTCRDGGVGWFLLLAFSHITGEGGNLVGERDVQ